MDVLKGVAGLGSGEADNAACCVLGVSTADETSSIMLEPPVSPRVNYTISWTVKP